MDVIRAGIDAMMQYPDFAIPFMTMAFGTFVITSFLTILAYAVIQAMNNKVARFVTLLLAAPVIVIGWCTRVLLEFSIIFVVCVHVVIPAFNFS